MKHPHSPSSVWLYSLLLVLLLDIPYKRLGDSKLRGRWRLLAPEEENIRIVVQKFLGRVACQEGDISFFDLGVIHGVKCTISTGRGLRSSSHGIVVSTGRILAGVD